MKKLSKTGKTNFKVDNMDWGFIHSALECYEEEIKATEFPKNSIMTKGFILDRVESLKNTFMVGE